MTPLAALVSLEDAAAAGRLRFGDPGQIEALNILEMAERLIGQEYACQTCDGEGIIGGPEAHCLECGRQCEYCSEKRCASCHGARVRIYTKDDVYRLSKSTLIEILGGPPARFQEAA